MTRLSGKSMFSREVIIHQCGLLHPLTSQSLGKEAGDHLHAILYMDAITYLCPHLRVDLAKYLSVSEIPVF